MFSSFYDDGLSGDEVDRSEATRRIEANLARLSRSGIQPANIGPYFGAIPRNSPLGEVLGRGIQKAQETGYRTAALGAAMTPQRLIESFGGFAADLGWKAGEKVGEVTKWAVTPRGASKKAAFVPQEADPRTRPDDPGSPPAIESPPTRSQITDAAGRGSGIDSSKVPAIEAAPKPRPTGLSVKVGDQWIDYNPDTSPDIGAPGRGGFVQPNIESMPAGNRPASYFDDLRAQRAIERAQVAPGELGRMGFTFDEAAPYMGEAFVRERAASPAVAAQRAQDERRYGQDLERRSFLRRDVGSVGEDIEEIHQELEAYKARVRADVNLSREDKERKVLAADAKADRLIQNAFRFLQGAYGLRPDER